MQHALVLSVLLSLTLPASANIIEAHFDATVVQAMPSSFFIFNQPNPNFLGSHISMTLDFDTTKGFTNLGGNNFEVYGLGPDSPYVFCCNVFGSYLIWHDDGVNLYPIQAMLSIDGYHQWHFIVGGQGYVQTGTCPMSCGYMEVTNATLQDLSVPGPVVGTGLPALFLILLGLIAWLSHPGLRAPR